MEEKVDVIEIDFSEELNDYVKHDSSNKDTLDVSGTNKHDSDLSDEDDDDEGG